jgi:hypothetical protein
MRELRPMLVRSCSALSLVSLLAACGEERETITPTVGPITESIYASGVVKAQGQYTVYPTVSGTVTALLVQEGDTVKAGQALLSIDDRNSALGTRNAEAQLRLLEQNARDSGPVLSQLRQAVQQARDRYHVDSLNHARQQALWAQQIGSRNELDQRELAYTTSKAAYDRASEALVENRQRLRTELDVARNNAAISTAGNDDRTPRSLIEGIVYDLLIEPGELATTQKALGDHRQCHRTLPGAGGGRVRHPPGEARPEGIHHAGQLRRTGLRGRGHPHHPAHGRTFAHLQGGGALHRPAAHPLPQSHCGGQHRAAHQGAGPHHPRRLPAGGRFRPHRPGRAHLRHPRCARDHGEGGSPHRHRRHHHPLQTVRERYRMKLLLSIALTLLRAKLKQSIVAAVGVMFSITMFVTLLGFMNGLNTLLDGLILNRTPHIRLYNELQASPTQPIEHLGTARSGRCR